MKMTQAELDQKLDSHEAWRRGEGGEKFVATGLDLSGLSFSGRDLSGISFLGCNLRGCNFSNSKGANISGARF
jgi:uncharacterized protein YjbI with pentapeptide repeats